MTLLALERVDRMAQALDVRLGGPQVGPHVFQQGEQLPGEFACRFIGDAGSSGEQWRRLPGGAGNRKGGAGQDSAHARRQHDPEHGPPAARAEGERALAQGARYEREHLLRGARDQWQHDDRERERALPRRLAAADHEQAEDEDPEDDRRQAVQDVEDEPNAGRHPGGREFAHIERDEDADRQRHRRGDPDDHDAADESVGDTAAGLAERRRGLREEAPVERAGSPPRHGDDHEREHGDRGEGRKRRERFHHPVHEFPSPGSAAGRERNPGDVDRHQSAPRRS